ncbi:NifU family protein [Streptomyces tubbatahanensis]|uniref:NifU family protein n=1 Tax=Streptomyces tubbatahanensis TaxID=2923272 RepID=A0ABY3XZW7_9ACTN|nr:NifU family protein [Streptomyces tubbatahanensis]UNS99879.1 NifU family protein [Streptomyces tubbatahanensis]
MAEDQVTAPGHRLADADVEARLARLDELLERVESVAGPTAEAALEAVRGLTQVYGEALARVRDLAGPRLTGALTDDRLLSHLLVLHQLHPDPVEQRVADAVEGVRAVLAQRGADVELVGVEAGVASVRVTAKGCGTSATTALEAVRETLLAAAPELTAVRRVASEPAPAFVPLADMLPTVAPAAGTP